MFEWSIIGLKKVVSCWQRSDIILRIGNYFRDSKKGDLNPIKTEEMGSVQAPRTHTDTFQSILFNFFSFRKKRQFLIVFFAVILFFFCNLGTNLD